MHFAKAEKHIASADVVITGEGRLDGQTLQGKVVAGVAALAKRNGKPVIAFCGRNEVDYTIARKAGIDAVFSLMDIADNAEDAMTRASALLTRLAATVAAQYWQRK